MVKTYHCQKAYLCGCKAQMKLVFTDTNCAIWRYLEHDVDSHKIHKGKGLSGPQKHYLETAARGNPLELPSTLRRGTYNLSPEQRIGPEHKRSASDLVRRVRRDILDEILGVPNTTRLSARRV